MLRVAYFKRYLMHLLCVQLPRSVAYSNATWTATWAMHVVLLAASGVNALTLVRYNDQLITSLPKVIWEQGRVAAAVPGAGWHKGLRIRNVCIVFLKDRCANVQYFSVRKQE